MTTTRRRSRLEGTRERLGLTRVCPNGQILRVPYTRKFSNSVRESGYNVKRGNKTYRIYPKVSSVLVKASCIDNKGLPGKGRSLIGPLRKGELTKYGYNVHKSEDDRHKALKKAIAVYGALSVFRKLNAVVQLTKHAKKSASDAHKIFAKDLSWVQKNYTLKNKK
jgi:hypothetical protein